MCDCDAVVNRCFPKIPENIIDLLRDANNNTVELFDASNKTVNETDVKKGLRFVYYFAYVVVTRRPTSVYTNICLLLYLCHECKYEQTIRLVFFTYLWHLAIESYSF